MNLLELLQFMLQLFGEFWPVAALIALVITAYVYGGRPLALIAGTVGVFILTYLKGRRDEQERASKAAREVREKREKAYEDIDDRHTGVSDVARRLRNRTF